jgi:hypothetical protein
MRSPSKSDSNRMPPCCASSLVSIRQHTSAYVSIRQHTSAYVSISQHTSAYISIRQHTPAYASIPAVRLPSRYRLPGRPISVSICTFVVVVKQVNFRFTWPSLSKSRWLPRSYAQLPLLLKLRKPARAGEGTSSASYVSKRQLTSAYVSLRQLTSAYVSLRQLTSAYVSIRQHTSAYVSTERTRRLHRTLAYVAIRQHTPAYASIRARAGASAASGPKESVWPLVEPQ